MEPGVPGAKPVSSALSVCPALALEGHKLSARGDPSIPSHPPVPRHQGSEFSPHPELGLGLPLPAVGSLRV